MTFPERIDQFLGAKPTIAASAFVAPNATIVGSLTLDEESSVWFSATLRGDINFIHVGAHSNIPER